MSRGGLGAWGVVDGLHVDAGNASLMVQRGIAIDALGAQVEAWTGTGKTPIYVAVNGTLAGAVALADPVKATAAPALAKLRAAGLRLLMLTGDHERTARAIAAPLGIDEVVAGVSPEGKIETIRMLQSEGRIVAMVGDGVNDAPALAQADVGFALASGSDVAYDAAAVTLMRGDLNGVAQAIQLSRLTMRIMRQNLGWAFLYNVIGIPVAAGVLYPVAGILLTPIMASAAMALSSWWKRTATAPTSSFRWPRCKRPCAASPASSCATTCATAPTTRPRLCRANSST
jgi:Cu+-exporting ATPase